MPSDRTSQWTLRGCERHDRWWIGPGECGLCFALGSSQKPVEIAVVPLSAAATARLDHSEAELELLRDIWRLSQQDRMIIWVAGELQRFVLEHLGGEDADVDAILFQRASLGEGEGDGD